MQVPRNSNIFISSYFANRFYQNITFAISYFRCLLLSCLYHGKKPSAQTKQEQVPVSLIVLLVYRIFCTNMEYFPCIIKFSDVQCFDYLIQLQFLTMHTNKVKLKAFQIKHSFGQIVTIRKIKGYIFSTVSTPNVLHRLFTSLTARIFYLSSHAIGTEFTKLFDYFICSHCHCVYLVTTNCKRISDSNFNFQIAISNGLGIAS